MLNGRSGGSVAERGGRLAFFRRVSNQSWFRQTVKRYATFVQLNCNFLKQAERNLFRGNKT